MAWKKGDPAASAAGRKGGKATIEKYGAEFMAAIGQKGGSTLAAKIGRAGFKEMGRKGGSVSGKSRRRPEAGRKDAN